MRRQCSVQMQFFNALVGLDATQREPLSRVSELKRQGPLSGWFHGDAHLIAHLSG